MGFSFQNYVEYTVGALSENRLNEARYTPVLGTAGWCLNAHWAQLGRVNRPKIDVCRAIGFRLFSGSAAADEMPGDRQVNITFVLGRTARAAAFEADVDFAPPNSALIKIGCRPNGILLRPECCELQRSEARSFTLGRRSAVLKFLSGRHAWQFIEQARLRRRV